MPKCRAGDDAGRGDPRKGLLGQRQAADYPSARSASLASTLTSRRVGTRQETRPMKSTMPSARPSAVRKATRGDRAPPDVLPSSKKRRPASAAPRTAPRPSWTSVRRPPPAGDRGVGGSEPHPGNPGRPERRLPGRLVRHDGGGGRPDAARRRPRRPGNLGDLRHDCRSPCPSAPARSAPEPCAKPSSSSGGPRAGWISGGRRGSPDHASAGARRRTSRMENGSVRKAISRMASPHPGQTSGKVW